MLSTNTYNAFGQVVETDYPVYPAKGDGVFGPGGHELGYYNALNGAWYDRDIWAAGRMVAQSYPSDTYFLHAGVLHSDAQITDYSGAVQNDWIYYPWQDWTHWGIAVDAHFAGFQQSEGPNYGTPTRTYSGGQGRWLSPDPESAGANPANPQSWNAYSYAGNNPTTNTDPSGLGPCTIENFGSGGCWGGPMAGPGGVGGSGCMMNGVTVPCGLAEGELASGFACLGSCSTPVVGSNGVTYQAVQTAGPTVYVGPNGEELSTGSAAEVGLPAPMPQPPTWWLQTRVFASALGNNFVSEFKPNGCFAQFAAELATSMAASANPPGAGPEDMIRTVGRAGAATYAAARALSYPLKSSVYRGILGVTEDLAAGAAIAPVDYEAGKAFIGEMKSLVAGTCQ